MQSTHWTASTSNTARVHTPDERPRQNCPEPAVYFVVLTFLLLIIGPLAALRTPTDIFPDFESP
jgi:hypothetical protein